MKKTIRKAMWLTLGLFTRHEIRSVNKLLSNKNCVYNNYYEVLK